MEWSLALISALLLVSLSTFGQSIGQVGECAPTPTVVCRPEGVTKRRIVRLLLSKDFKEKNPEPYHCGLEWETKDEVTGECKTVSAELDTPDYFQKHGDTPYIVGHGSAPFMHSYRIVLRPAPMHQTDPEWRQVFSLSDQQAAHADQCFAETTRAYAAHGGPDFTISQTCSTFASYLLTHCGGLDLTAPENHLNLPGRGTAPGWGVPPKFKDEQKIPAP